MGRKSKSPYTKEFLEALQRFREEESERLRQTTDEPLSEKDKDDIRRLEAAETLLKEAERLRRLH